MRYWLMKSEPTDYSIDDLKRDGFVPWYGIRNYQARNFMRDQMELGDGVLFYHSSCPEPGIVGLAEVGKLAYPDATQFDEANKYYDPKAKAENPRWLNVDVKYVKKTRLMSLQEIRGYSELSELKILQRGNRLSITPVTQDEWNFIVKHLD